MKPSKPGKTKKNAKPKRSYRAAFHSIRQVLKTFPIHDDHSIHQFGTPNRETLPQKELRVAVWNICKGMGESGFRHELQMLLRDCDLLLMQEALLSDDLTTVLAHHSFQAIHGASYARRDGIRDGVMTLSRAPAMGVSQRILCKNPEPVLRTAKTALLTQFYIEGMITPLIVVNLHATLIRSVKSAIEELRHLLMQLPIDEGPMIVAGDFNTFTKAYLRAAQQELKDFGLEMIDIPDDPRRPLYHLDHIFVRGLKVRSAQVDITMKNSDHFPLIVTLDAG